MTVVRQATMLLSEGRAAQLVAIDLCSIERRSMVHLDDDIRSGGFEMPRGDRIPILTEQRGVSRLCVVWGGSITR
jgi:hypothetical protein